MVAIIKKGANKKAIESELRKAKPVRGLDSKKYLGLISLKENPVDIQKRLRDEWE